MEQRAKEYAKRKDIFGLTDYLGTVADHFKPYLSYVAFREAIVSGHASSLWPNMREAIQYASDTEDLNVVHYAPPIEGITGFGSPIMEDKLAAARHPHNGVASQGLADLPADKNVRYFWLVEELTRYGLDRLQRQIPPEDDFLFIILDAIVLGAKPSLTWLPISDTYELAKLAADRDFLFVIDMLMNQSKGVVVEAIKSRENIRQLLDSRIIDRHLVNILAAGLLLPDIRLGLDDITDMVDSGELSPPIVNWALARTPLAASEIIATLRRLVGMRKTSELTKYFSLLVSLLPSFAGELNEIAEECFESGLTSQLHSLAARFPLTLDLTLNPGVVECLSIVSRWIASSSQHPIWGQTIVDMNISPVQLARASGVRVDEVTNHLIAVNLVSELNIFQQEIDRLRAAAQGTASQMNSLLAMPVLSLFQFMDREKLQLVNELNLSLRVRAELAQFTDVSPHWLTEAIRSGDRQSISLLARVIPGSLSEATDPEVASWLIKNLTADSEQLAMAANLAAARGDCLLLGWLLDRGAPPPPPPHSLWIAEQLVMRNIQIPASELVLHSYLLPMGWTGVHQQELLQEAIVQNSEPALTFLVERGVDFIQDVSLLTPWAIDLLLKLGKARELLAANAITANQLMGRAVDLMSMDLAMLAVQAGATELYLTNSSIRQPLIGELDRTIDQLTDEQRLVYLAFTGPVDLVVNQLRRSNRGVMPALKSASDPAIISELIGRADQWQLIPAELNQLLRMKLSAGNSAAAMALLEGNRWPVDHDSAHLLLQVGMQRLDREMVEIAHGAPAHPAFIAEELLEQALRDEDVAGMVLLIDRRWIPRQQLVDAIYLYAQHRRERQLGVKLSSTWEPSEGLVLG